MSLSTNMAKNNYKKMVVYVDETLECGNKQFPKLMYRIPATVQSKTRQFSSVLFAGVNIHQKDDQ